METAPGAILIAGRPAWYSLVAVSFFTCEFNLVAAVAVALGFNGTRSTALGWALTAASFMLGLSGLIVAQRIAYVDRNRRALELGSIITIGAGLIPLLAGLSMPAIVMWPIAAMFVLVGASGMRASRDLGHPRPDVGAGEVAKANSPIGVHATAPQSLQQPQSPKPRRRRRGKRRRNADGP